MTSQYNQSSICVIMCNGDSERFKSEGYKQPKFFLRHPKYLTTIDAINQLTEMKTVVALGERFVNKSFKKENIINTKVKGADIIYLDKCSSHLESCIHAALKLKEIYGGKTPVCFRDSDVIYKTKNISGPNNLVLVSNKESHPDISEEDKGKLSEVGQYIGKTKDKGLDYSIGAYYFKSLDFFLGKAKKSESEIGKCFDRWDVLKHKGEIEDLGCPESWEKNTSQYKTIFLDIDGTILKQKSSKEDGFKDPTPLIKTLSHLRALYKDGKTEIILTTGRGEHLKKITEDQLNELRVPYDRLIMGLQHSKRIIVNDYVNEKTAFSINVKRDADELKELWRF